MQRGAVGMTLAAPFHCKCSERTDDEMTAMEQYRHMKATQKFLEKWGLKQKYVASVCKISETDISKFLNGKMALSEKQLDRLLTYETDYIRRNSGRQ